VLLLISYDLATSDRPSNYEAIRGAIDAAAQEAYRPLYSQWLVVTSEDVDTWTSRLTPLLSPEDKLLIVRIQGRANGRLPKTYWPWINAHAV
jgi:hypothetical protein